MRDILDKLETLTESTGLAGRKAGDVFRNPNGDEMVFNNIQFVPAKGGKLDDKKLDSAIADIKSQTGNIEWQNARTSRTGGFALATFDTAKGERYIGRYLEQTKPNFTDNYVPNQVGDYRLATKAALKAQSGLSPQDLLTNKVNQTSSSIIKQLAVSLGTEHPLYAVAYKLATGSPLPMTFDAPKDISFTGFRDYFCEILQPIALQKGQYTGNAGEAADIFLDGGFKGTLITFDDSKNAGLSDSLMSTKDGRSIKVSSKGGRGATASTKNLIDSIDELAQTPNGKKLLRKYKDVVDMLREVQRRGQIGAPLYLGVKFNIIDEDDAKQILALKNSTPIDLRKIEKFGLSDNLVDLALGRSTNTPGKVSLYYHLVAAVAYKAAIEVNDNTDFSKAASDILNNGALVQVYTKAKESKGKWTLDEFQTVYPGQSIKSVYFSAGKTYMSTGSKGNFTFKIDKGGNKPKNDEPATVAKRTAGPVAAEKDFLKKAATIATGKRAPVAKPKPKATGKMGDVGRKLRKT
jgi:hypothetical protein